MCLPNPGILTSVLGGILSCRKSPSIEAFRFEVDFCGVIREVGCTALHEKSPPKFEWSTPDGLPDCCIFKRICFLTELAANYRFGNLIPCAYILC